MKQTHSKCKYLDPISYVVLIFRLYELLFKNN